MTEDEAKTKWCPMVRFVNYASADEGLESGARAVSVLADSMPHNRFQVNTDKTAADTTEHFALKCIGSACMLWRWTAGMPVTPLQDGYCGLAGKP